MVKGFIKIMEYIRTKFWNKTFTRLNFSASIKRFMNSRVETYREEEGTASAEKFRRVLSFVTKLSSHKRSYSIISTK